MLTLLLLTACGSSEHQIIDSSSPSLAGDEEACEPTVVEQPVINLSCPEPVINLSCPDPVVQVEVAAPDVQVAVAAPEVDVNVAGPDMTGIEAAIDDMTLTIDDTLSNITSSAGNTDIQWAHIGTHSNPNSNTWTNNSSDTAIITTAGTSQGGCDVYTASGVMEMNDFCDGSMCSLDAWSPGTQGVLSIPVEPGGWVDCYQSNSARFYIGGYYQ
tara:strand:- start:84 stop:725 length:642 start_codon:yes stop_codon:yes gene_type:complete